MCVCQGVIDILQQYTAAKKLEHTVKAMALGSEAVSCADPYYYEQRFIRRLASHMTGDDAIDPLTILEEQDNSTAQTTTITTTAKPNK